MTTTALTPTAFQHELERALLADLTTKLTECLNMAQHLRRWDIESHLAKALQARRGKP